MALDYKFARNFATKSGMATFASLPSPWEIPAPRKRYFVEKSSLAFTPMTDAFNTLKPIVVRKSVAMRKPSAAIAIALPTPNDMVTFALPTPNAIVRTFFTKSEASWTKSGDM